MIHKTAQIPANVEFTFDEREFEACLELIQAIRQSSKGTVNHVYDQNIPPGFTTRFISPDQRVPIKITKRH